MSIAPIQEETICLTQLAPGQSGTICDVEASPGDVLRLMGLGICAGRRLETLKLGDPLILRVYGTRIGLAAALARRVKVRLGEATCAVPVVAEQFG